MANHSGAAYLRTRQYRDGTNFNARVALHARFSTNPQGWNRWLFDQLAAPTTARVLEVGCGPAWFWVINRDRLPPGWAITLTDFSPGMIAEAARNLAGVPHSCTYAVADVQALPFPPAHFDLILANHMLYHVPDRALGLTELRRVLRPSGCLYAATNGQGHMREFDALLAPFVPPRPADAPPRPLSPRTFTLENGGPQLAAHFATVTLRRYDDALAVTEAEPLVAYAHSMSAGLGLPATTLDAVRRHITQALAAQGTIHISKDAGLFIAC